MVNVEEAGKALKILRGGPLDTWLSMAHHILTPVICVVAALWIGGELYVR